MDVGTGGGFPGIPLAILFPETHFLLIDSIGKKIKVAKAVAEAIGLENVTLEQKRAEEVKECFDFVVSRAVMPLKDMVRVIQKNIKKKQQNSLPNGLIYLKGGDLEEELRPYKRFAICEDLRDYFKDEYFDTKKIVFIAL